LNKAEFHILLKHPENLDKARVAELKALLVEFPYFQAGKMLLLKNLHNLKHYEYDKTLRHVSISVPDRVRLFQYIENQIPTTILPPSTKQVVVEKAETIEELTPTNSTEAILDENLTNDLFIETIAESKIDLPTAEPIVVTDEEAVEIVAENPKETEQVVESKAPLVISLHETHSFSDWLILSKTGVQPEEPLNRKLENELVPPTIVEQTPLPELNKPNAIVEKNQASQSNVNDFESILDKFIRENPRISRPKAEFYNPANMAKQSVEENEDIATETLAKLYVNQGHIKKAIRTYEKLCLIYPHRITYFADLIQKIKTEHKD
jgi:hypothetical protein